MRPDVRIRLLNTGWIEQVESAHFIGGGKNPDAPNGQITAWGREESKPRPDGTTSHGSVMIPTSVWLIETADRHILFDTGIVPPDELSIVHKKYEGTLATSIRPEDEIAAQLAQ